jgi:hypothetical protein
MNVCDIYICIRAHENIIFSATMASTKLTEPPKNKATFLTPDKMPEVILDTDSEESENDNNGTVDEEDCEQCGPDQSLLQQESESSLNGYTLFKHTYHY